LKIPCQELVPLALDAGLLVNVIAEHVIRLLPPLIISEAQIDEIASNLITCINHFTG
jgi:acetylornithine aminotransferase